MVTEQELRAALQTLREAKQAATNPDGSFDCRVYEAALPAFYAVWNQPGAPGWRRVR